MQIDVINFQNCKKYKFLIITLAYSSSKLDGGNLWIDMYAILRMAKTPEDLFKGA